MKFNSNLNLVQTWWVLVQTLELDQVASDDEIQVQILSQVYKFDKIYLIYL
jgi:hypothetical protein